MRNRMKVLFVMVIALISLTACGVRADKDVTSGEMAVPEVSSGDLLVSSLEYLLLDDDEEDEISDQDSSSSNQEEEVQDDRDTVEKSEDASDEQSAQTENDVQGEEAIVYYGNGGSVALKQETIEVETVTPDELVGALARHNIVSLDTKVVSFEQEEESGAAVLYLDLSKAAGEYLRTMSKEAECIIVAAVVNTFLGNYDADAMYITVEGEALATSNAEYTEAIGQCTPAELLEMLISADSDDNATGVMNDSADEVICNLPLAEE